MELIRPNRMAVSLTLAAALAGVGAAIALLEIRQGSKAAIEKSIAGMGANMLVVQSGAATTSGGVTLSAGSVLTLTPQDADEINRQCPAVSNVAPVLYDRSQVIYGRRNWVPASIYGTTPSFLAVHDWNELAEGEMFGEHDVRDSSTVCVIGETVRRELLEEESAVGKEIRIQDVPFQIIGVLSRKGTNTMGLDQDDILLAPWTTIKYRISGTSAAVSGVAVTPLGRFYPGSRALYPLPSPVEMANTPRSSRFTNVDQILVKAASAEAIPQAIEQISDLLRERHGLRPDEPADFNVHDLADAGTSLDRRK